MGTLSSLHPELTLSSPRDIRLVLLHPALEHNASLICDLDVTSLDDAPEFEALSHVWGPTTRQSSAACTGIETTLTDNLADTHRRLRDKARVRIIGVDAFDRVADVKTNVFNRFSTDIATSKPALDLAHEILAPLSPDEIRKPGGESILHALGRTYTTDLLLVPGGDRLPRNSSSNLRKPDVHSRILGRKGPCPADSDATADSCDGV